MGDCACLSSFDGRLLSAPSLEAKYYVPIFWLALFEPRDLHEHDPIAEAQFAAMPRVFSIAPPYLLARAEQANERFARRSVALARLCGPAHAPLVAKFAAFAQTLKPTILVRLDALATMSTPGTFVEQVRGALRLVSMLDDPDAESGALRGRAADERVERERLAEQRLRRRLAVRLGLAVTEPAFSDRRAGGSPCTRRS